MLDVQVRGKSEVQIAARDAIGHMDYLRERLNSSQEAIEVCCCPLACPESLVAGQPCYVAGAMPTMHATRVLRAWHAHPAAEHRIR